LPTLKRSDVSLVGKLDSCEPSLWGRRELLVATTIDVTPTPEGFRRMKEVSLEGVRQHEAKLEEILVANGWLKGQYEAAPLFSLEIYNVMLEALDAVEEETRTSILNLNVAIEELEAAGY
jgi:hypothetical protein